MSWSLYFFTISMFLKFGKDPYEHTEIAVLIKAPWKTQPHVKDQEV